MSLPPDSRPTDGMEQIPVPDKQYGKLESSSILSPEVQEILSRPVEHIPTCKDCERISTSKCYACGRRFCGDHGSQSDAALCNDCGLTTDPQPLNIDVSITPLLVDDEGVEHLGKHITPVGDTYSFTRWIDSLDDSDLDAMALEYQGKVKEAEKILYSRVIVAGTLTQAVSDRKRKRNIEARAARFTQRHGSPAKLSMPGIQTQARKPKAQEPTTGEALAATMRSMMSTPEGKAKLAAMLASLTKGV